MSVFRAAIRGVCLCALLWSACSDTPLPAAEPAPESVQTRPSACARTQACGGDPVGRWRIVSMCTRAPEIVFDAYTDLPFAKCKGQVRAAEIDARGSLEVSSGLSLDMDYQLESRLTLVWSARCLNTDPLTEAQCSNVEDALRARSELEAPECSLHDQECTCALRASLHVEAADLEGARQLFAAAEQCVMAERMTMDDGSTTLQLERADSE